MKIRRAPGLPFILFLSMRGTPEGLDRAADMTYYSTFWITVTNALSVTPARKPSGLGFNQSRLNHTRLALTTRGLSVVSYAAFSHHATLPPLFRDSSSDEQG